MPESHSILDTGLLFFFSSHHVALLHMPTKWGHNQIVSYICFKTRNTATINEEKQLPLLYFLILL